MAAPVSHSQNRMLPSMQSPEGQGTRGLRGSVRKSLEVGLPRLNLPWPQGPHLQLHTVGSG